MMNKNKILINASVVLHLIDNTQGLTYNELKERSQLSDKELGITIGWLACENKILLSPDDDKLYLNGYFYF